MCVPSYLDFCFALLFFFLFQNCSFYSLLVFLFLPVPPPLAYPSTIHHIVRRSVSLLLQFHGVSLLWRSPSVPEVPGMTCDSTVWPLQRCCLTNLPELFSSSSASSSSRTCWRSHWCQKNLIWNFWASWSCHPLSWNVRLCSVSSFLSIFWDLAGVLFGDSVSDCFSPRQSSSFTVLLSITSRHSFKTEHASQSADAHL